MNRKCDPDTLYNWTIYKIISPSNKIYIGQTVNFKKRMSHYKNNESKAQKLIYRSIKKYGWEQHRVEIVEEFIGIKKLVNEKEIFWIDFYKCNRSKYPKGNGLNLTDGGEGTVGNKLSERSKNLISKANTGRKMSAESLRKRVETLKSLPPKTKEERNKITEKVLATKTLRNSFGSAKGADNSNTKLTESQVLEIISRYNSEEDITSIAKELEINTSIVEHVIYGHTWRDYTHLLTRKPRNYFITPELVKEIQEKFKQDVHWSILCEEYNISRAIIYLIKSNKGRYAN